MSYATQADIDRHYPGSLEQAGPRNADGELDTDAIAAALAWADSQIDARLGQRYGLPLVDPIPTWVVSLAVDLALYRATPAPVLDDFKDRHTRAVSALNYLDNIRLGLITPSVSPAVADPPGVLPLAGVEFPSGRRDFSDDKLW